MYLLCSPPLSPIVDDCRVFVIVVVAASADVVVVVLMVVNIFMHAESS